jgi:threonine/homoserine/homoserine lactone efflux protein
MTFLTLGIILGLSAGFTPGPLLTLVITETLRHDIKSGVKVALAPVITDFPIVIITLYILTKVSHLNSILGIISLIGAVFILCMGYSNLQIKGMEFHVEDVKSKSLIKGILANALSPYPYIFWLSVGAPTMTKAMDHNSIAGVAFLGSFYLLLVGSKIILALLVGKSKSFLAGSVYIYIMRFLGLLLCIFSLALFHEGLKLLEIF